MKDKDIQQLTVHEINQIESKSKRRKSTLSWDEMYHYAQIYYQHHGNLEVPQKFKTNDGFTLNENGMINLGTWINTQRQNTPKESNRGQLLLKIGMRFEKIINKLPWKEMYKYAKIYYEHYGNLEIPFKFKTNDGFTFDKNGKINLGTWINTQRQNTPKESERGQLLLKIGMRFEKIRSTLSWNEMYHYAQIYYQHYGNLKVPRDFKTNDGFTFNENGTISLGRWVYNQIQNISKINNLEQLLTLKEMLQDTKEYDEKQKVKKR